MIDLDGVHLFHEASPGWQVKDSDVFSSVAVYSSTPYSTNLRTLAGAGELPDGNRSATISAST